MKAVVQYRYGSPDVLQVSEIGKPAIGADEVLVGVRAASVGAWADHVMQGDPLLMRLAFGLRKPSPVRETDLAGVVEGVGSNVSGFQPGDKVYGESKAAFAEFAAVSADAISPMPKNLTFAQAAAVPVAAQTALLGLRDHGRLKPNQRVLIIGAAGGVGTFAVQIAKALGGEVTGVCSSQSVELLKSLGADYVIDYAQHDFTQLGKTYDLVFQGAGANSLSELRSVLTDSGTLVLSSGEGGRWVGPLPRLARAMALSPFVGHKLKTFMATPDADNLAFLTELIEAGQVTPVIDRTFPLADVADAFRHFEKGHNQGKTVVTMGSS